jgi:hypothetical protein
MNSSIVRTLVTFGLSAVALMAQGPLKATIPFDFNVGSKSFAAGVYTVHQVNGHVLRIQNINGETGILEMVQPADPSSKRGNCILTFNRYGGSYFLAKVSEDTKAWNFHRSRAEKEMIAKAAPPKSEIVAALRSK